MTAAVGLSACGEAPEEETVFGDYEYAVKNGTVEITGYVGDGGALTLPSVINGKTVTSIGSNVFYYCDTLTSVVLPSGLTSIGAYAFRGCNALISVRFNSGLTSIGYGAFYDCGLLTDVVLPDSVTSLNWQAFTNCGGMESIVIGKGMASIGDYAFAGCEGLEEVFYMGTESKWKEIEIASCNECLTDVERYYYSETQPTNEGNYWHYENGVATVW